MAINILSESSKSHRIRQIDEQFAHYLRSTFDCSNLILTEDYVQHGGTSCLMHSIAVAYYSYRLALKLRLSFHAKELITGALLHDYCLYDWRDKDPTHRMHAFTHPRAALENAGRELTLSPIEQDVIRKHMFPLTPIPPRYRESLLVSLLDKACCLYELCNRRAYGKLRKMRKMVLSGGALA